MIKIKKDEIAINQNVKPAKVEKKVNGEIKEYFDINPFLNKLIVKTRSKGEIYAKGLKTVDSDNNEVDSVALMKTKTVDTADFVKLYTDSMISFFELKSAARKVLMAVLLRLKEPRYINQDQIQLTYNQAMKIFKKYNIEEVTSTYFSSGITQLIKVNLLAASTEGEGWYFINPNFIFNGNRIVFIEQFIEKNNKEKPLTENDEDFYDEDEPEQLSLVEKNKYQELPKELK